jgi:hypothetical protein
MLGEGGTPLSDLEKLEAAVRKFLARNWALIVALKDRLAPSAGEANEVEVGQ